MNLEKKKAEMSKREERLEGSVVQEGEEKRGYKIEGRGRATEEIGRSIDGKMEGKIEKGRRTKRRSIRRKKMGRRRASKTSTSISRLF